MKLFNVFKRKKIVLDTDLGSESWGQFIIDGAPRNITEDLALKIIAVFACVRLISETMATVPFFTYKNLVPVGKERDTNHILDFLFTNRANRWMSCVPFKERMQKDLLLNGNAYAQIIRNRRGEILELVPLFPERMKIEFRKLKKVYVYTGSDNQRVEFKDNEIFHILNFSGDGIVGLSVLETASPTFQGALDADDLSKKLLENGGIVGSILEYPEKLSADQVKKLRQHWNEMHRGTQNAGKVAILQKNMTYKPMSLKSSDVELLTTRKFDVIQICRAFNVPPHKIMDFTDSHYNNITAAQTQWVMDTIRPWCVRWEDAVKSQLHTYLGTSVSHKSEFLIDSLLRGDVKTRSEVYAMGRQWGYYSTNDIRNMENRNPVDGGDDYHIPANMVVLEYPNLKLDALTLDMKLKEAGEQSAGSLVDDNPAGAGSWKTTLHNSKDIDSFVSSYKPIIKNIVGRYTRRLYKKLENLRGSCKDNDTFLEHFSNYVKEKERAKITGEVGVVFRSLEIYLGHKEGALSSLVSGFVERYEHEARDVVSSLSDYYQEPERFLNYCGQGLEAVSDSFFNENFLRLLKGKDE